MAEEAGCAPPLVSRLENREEQNADPADAGAKDQAGAQALARTDENSLPDGSSA